MKILRRISVWLKGYGPSAALRVGGTAQQRREAQQLSELLQDAGQVGFFDYHFGADALTWTPGLCKLFGIDDSPPTGLQQWYARMEAGDRRRTERDIWTSCAMRRESATLEYGVPLPEGTLRWLCSRIVLQYDAQGRAVRMMGVTVDMSHHKQAEHERIQSTEHAIAAQREAQAASRAKDDLLALLSHELRNALGAIEAASAVLEQTDPGSATALEAHSIIARQGRDLAQLVNELPDAGRIMGGNLALARRPVNLASIVRQVHYALTADRSGQPPMALGLQEAWVDGDSARLEQMVSSLLAKVVHGTPKDSAIEVVVGLDQDTATLQVRASGRGAARGTALMLVRRLAELHGGTVDAVHSSEGSLVTVQLPAVAAPAVDDAGKLPPSRRRNVLVIEDNGDVLAALRSRLEREGHTVCTAADGVEGLVRLLKFRPEVSIVDVGLPGMTGFELARHARAAGYSGRMIALSGHGGEPEAQAARVAGFDACLVKPVDREQLRSSLGVD